MASNDSALILHNDVANSRSNIPQCKNTMDLPAEMRNTIWEFVLHRAKGVVVDRHFDEPPLLKVSSEIRRETKGLFYNTNTFHILIQRCDASKFIGFQNHIQKQNLPNTPTIHLSLDGCANRANLFTWCKAVYNGLRPVARTVCPASTESRQRVITSALGMAFQGHQSKLDWAVVQNMLLLLMHAVETNDDGW